MLILQLIWSRSSMDRMTDSGSVGWAFESPRDHKERVLKGTLFNYLRIQTIFRIKGRRERRGGAFEPSPDASGRARERVYEPACV